MCTEKQARRLMIRHHQMIKNRQQSMLGRSAAEIGLDIYDHPYWGHIQGKPHPSFRKTYDRSTVAMS
ncbi:MAG: hypothetical protein QNJ54_17630 [Prochloraceae cyanobacterium]|nr:hypothetical protein [Prochloraceae cyanobacterium]